MKLKWTGKILFENSGKYIEVCANIFSTIHRFQKIITIFFFWEFELNQRWCVWEMDFQTSKRCSRFSWYPPRFCTSNVDDFNQYPTFPLLKRIQAFYVWNIFFKFHKISYKNRNIDTYTIIIELRTQLKVTMLS